MSEYVCHLRGLPWSASQTEIVSFLDINPEHISNVDITTNDRGKPSGEAFVTITDQGSAETALNKHKETFPGSSRWIEVIKSSQDRRKAQSANQGKSGSWDGVVRLRGLPFESGPNEVRNFFDGLNYINESLFCPRNERGSTGDAYVQFEDYTSANAALDKNKQLIGGRYIEVFKSNNNEMRKAMIQEIKNNAPPPNFGGNMGNNMGGNWGGLNLGGGGGGPMRGNNQNNRPGPYDRPDGNQGFSNQQNNGNWGGNQNNSFGGPPQQNGGNFGGPPQNDAFYGGAPQQQGQQNYGAPTGPTSAPPAQGAQVAGSSDCPFPHCIGMSGLPQGVQNKDVQEYFKPYKAIAINMTMGNGQADVAFKTHDDVIASMQNSGKPLNGNAITLTMKSTPPAPKNEAGFTMLNQGGAPPANAGGW